MSVNGNLKINTKHSIMVTNAEPAIGLIVPTCVYVKPHLDNGLVLNNVTQCVFDVIPEHVNYNS